MQSDHNASPVNPLPPVVIALAVVIFGIEFLFQMGERGLIGGPEAVGWRLNALQGYAFIGGIFDWMLANGTWPTEHLLRFVTYPLLHYSFGHMLFVIVFVLALGKMVAEVFSAFAVLAIFFLSAVIGALVYALALNDPAPLVGGYPAVYGLVGAYTFLMWVRLAFTGENQARAFTLIAVLMFVQLLFGLLFQGSNEWVADLSGFATGFLLSFLVVPGGWQRLVSQIRKRR